MPWVFYLKSTPACLEMKRGVVEGTGVTGIVEDGGEAETVGRGAAWLGVDGSTEGADRGFAGSAAG